PLPTAFPRHKGRPVRPKTLLAICSYESLVEFSFACRQRTLARDGFLNNRWNTHIVTSTSCAPCQGSHPVRAQSSWLFPRRSVTQIAMKHFSALNTLLCVLFLGTGSVPAADFQNLPGGLLIDANFYHLGNTVTNWPETSPKPHGTRLELQFKATANSREAVLSLNQRAVSGRCALRINGKEVAELRRNDAPATFLYRLPPGTLTNGLNLLTIAPVNTRNDL